MYVDETGLEVSQAHWKRIERASPELAFLRLGENSVNSQAKQTIAKFAVMKFIFRLASSGDSFNRIISDGVHHDFDHEDW